MGHPNFSASSRDYFKTPRRAAISLTTGQIYIPPLDGAGGDPYRFETDAEYQARLDAHDRKLSESQPPDGGKG